MKTQDIRYQDNFLDTYVNNYPEISDFYQYNPKDSDSFKKRLEYLDRIERRNLNAVASALLQYNLKLGCSSKTEENIQLLAGGSAYAVVTGQQTGILTGPLYTIYKIMTTIALAIKISEELEVHTVPVFWAASEDHDFYEIAKISVLSHDGSMKNMTVPSPKSGRISVGYLPLTEHTQKLINFVEDNTEDGPFKSEMIDLIQRSHDDSASISEWCIRLISALFKRYGLIILDSLDERLRKHAAEIFTAAVENSDKIHDSIENASFMLTQRGFKTQLTNDRSILQFFHNSRAGRYQIGRTDQGYTVLSDDSMEQYTANDLMERINKYPEQFSPNVVLRPIIQDHLLPTIAYVAGPGELAYYAQLKDVYPLFNMEMPIIYPRFSATLVFPAIHEIIVQLDLNTEKILGDPDSQFETVLRKKEILPINDRFDLIRNDISAAYRTLTNSISSIDPDLINIAEGNLGRIMAQVEYLEKKTKQKHRKREKETVTKFNSVRNSLVPDGRLQERTMNIFQYLFETGEDLIDMLFIFKPHESFSHRLIYLGDDENR